MVLPQLVICIDVSKFGRMKLGSEASFAEPDAMLQEPDAGPSYTIAARHAPPEATDSVPGPGEYAAPPSPPGAAYTIAGKRVDPQASVDSPGPGEYGNVAEHGGSGPAYTIAGKGRSSLQRGEQCAPRSSSLLAFGFLASCLAEQALIDCVKC